MKIVVIGGVAGGMSFAARARRLAEDAEIVVLERGSYVSFANCGLPYHLAGEIAERSDLILHTPESLSASLALDVRTGHEVLAIDPAARTVGVRDLTAGEEYDEPYDVLMLAPGASPAAPAIPGADLPAVRTLRTVPDVDELRSMVAGGARRAVVVGAGFIGLEAAEALAHAGLEVTVAELTSQVLPPLDPEMAQTVEREIRAAGIDVRVGVFATGIREADGGPRGAVLVDFSDGSSVWAGLVLVAVGVRPETTLAQAAGLTVDERGAIVVDEYLRTSDPAIYAVGDAIAVADAVTGVPVSAPLAGPANRQGRAAADHVFGRRARPAPVLGTAIVRVFGTVAAITGRSEKALRAAGIAHDAVHLHPVHHAGYYPGAKAIHLKLLFDTDGRVLGAQATGPEGVDKRIDVIATAIRAGLTVYDLAELDLAYAPPFGSAKDPVNRAGLVASNVLAGDLAIWRGSDLEQMAGDAVLLDVRSEAEYRSGHLPGARNIPHTELRARLGEVPENRPVLTYCASGFRSYLALRVLRQSGWDDVASLSGGIKTFTLERPDVELETGLAAARPAERMAAVTAKVPSVAVGD